MRTFSFSQWTRGHGEFPWTMATRTDGPDASGENSAPSRVNTTITDPAISIGRRSCSSSNISTTPAAKAMTITPHPLAPNHCPAPRGQASVPTGYPTDPQGNPPHGNRARRNSQSAHPPIAAVHHRHGAEDEDPREHGAEENGAEEESEPPRLAWCVDSAHRPEKRSRGDEDEKAEVHRGGGGPHQQGGEQHRGDLTHRRTRVAEVLQSKSWMIWASRVQRRSQLPRSFVTTLNDHAMPT